MATGIFPPTRALRVLAPIACCVMLLASAPGAAATTAPAEGAPPASVNIINGGDVTDASYLQRWSSIVAIGNHGNSANSVNGQFCGGTLIAPNLVVTAAHCAIDLNTGFTRTPSSLVVFVGAHDLRRFTQTIDVQAVFEHPGYHFSRLRYDIAVLRLKTPAAAPAVPIQLVQPGEAATWGAGAGLAGSDATGPWVAGWGNTEFDQLDAPNYPYNLKEVQVPIQSDTTCGRPKSGGAAEFEAQHMVCAGTLDADSSRRTTSGKGTCPGDSGGPLIVSADGDGEPWRLAGIVSWGSAFECAGPSYGFFARADAYRDWVQSISATEHGAFGLQDPVAPAVTARTVKSVSLAWSPPAGGPAPSGYALYDFFDFADNGLQIPHGKVRGNTARITGLWPNTTYEFHIKSHSVLGYSPGTHVRVRTLPDRTRPSRTPRAKVRARSSTSARLTWGRARDNHRVRRYAIYRSSGAGWQRIGRVDSPARVYLPRKLKPGRRYSFAVRAVDFAGNQGPLSRPVSVRTPAR